MSTIRIRTQNDLSLREKLHRLLRAKLPMAYLKPRGGKGYLDYTLDIPESEVEELRNWLSDSGFQVQ